MTHPAQPPRDRFCDLVMKGGITSGVVYPGAIGLLSEHYHFKSIGGTSAGAIAAAVTAAAEYQRRKTGSRAGFACLERLPEALGATLPGTGHSKLLSLFQPQPGTRRLFSVLRAALNAKGTWVRVARIALGLLHAYWLATLVSLIAAALAGYYLGWFTGLLVLLMALPVSIGFWVYLDLTQEVVANGFGLCTGMGEGKTEALTPWLHDLIQDAAGLSPSDPPLTFGQLWAVDAPPDWVDSSKRWRAIDLQMFTTSLGHGRPYVFPLPAREPGPSRFHPRDRLYFKASELAAYLPRDVLDWMMKKSMPYAEEPGRDEEDPPVRVAGDRRTLPAAGDFPVLLAARMSLSFPLLFSAVPLHAIDRDATGTPIFRPCWFSDGGICSNFPMHLFDGLVPSWPTFGINLEAKGEWQDMVYLPTHYEDGYDERWNRFADEDREPASRFGGFLAAIVGTMQNWNDNSLARMPGLRDRIARVRMLPDEGGMNLDMDKDQITAVATKGKLAAQKLIDRFALLTPAGRQAAGWDEHRFVRLNTLMKMLAERAPGVTRALSPGSAHATDFASLLQRAYADPEIPPGYEDRMSPRQFAALQAVTDALAVLAQTLEYPASEVAFTPIPKPELRVRPPL